MIIAMIKNATRVCGKAQGYLGLPVRDMIVIDNATGEQAPAMLTAWTPMLDELERLNKGANVIVSILGNVPPPMLINVDTELPDVPNGVQVVHDGNMLLPRTIEEAEAMILIGERFLRGG